MTDLQTALVESDKVIPHDILGLGVIAVMALYILIVHPSGIVFIILMVLVFGISVGVLVDLAAHGWSH